MTNQGFQRSNYGWCLYTKGLGNGKLMYLLIYVDDMLLACHDNKEILKIKYQVNKEFEIKD